jgi:hypothetical protein
MPSLTSGSAADAKIELHGSLDENILGSMGGHGTVHDEGSAALDGGEIGDLRGDIGQWRQRRPDVAAAHGEQHRRGERKTTEPAGVSQRYCRILQACHETTRLAGAIATRR